MRVPGDRAGGRTERRYCKPYERLITVRTVNYPEWNPGERLIIRKGFWGTDNVLASSTPRALSCTSPESCYSLAHVHITTTRSLACGWPRTLHPPPAVELSHQLLSIPPVAWDAWALPRYCGASSYASSRWRQSVQYTLPGARATGLVQPSC